MNKLVSEIITDLYDLRDTTTSALPIAKKLAAINNTLMYFRLYGDWKFTRRKKLIDYLNDEADYSIGGNLAINDFKNPDELRLAYEEGVNFTYEEPDHFSALLGQNDNRNFYTVEEKDGNKLLRINYPSFSKSSAIVIPVVTITEDGTWVIGDDGTNLRNDDQEYRYGGGSLRFDNVAYSAGKISLYNRTFTAVDLSDYEDIGHPRVWFYIPSTSYLASSDICKLRLGWAPSPDPATKSFYWQMISSVNSIGGSLEQGWNRIDFNWADAEKTGSPNSSAINYAYFEVNLASGAPVDTDWRLNQIKIFQPEKLEMLYFSSYMAKNGAGTWINEVTETTDYIIIPDEGYPAFKAKLMELLFRQIRGANSADAIYWNQMFQDSFRAFYRGWGFPNKQPIKRLKVWTSRWKKHGIRY